MKSVLAAAVGQRIRLYTASGVESYLGTLTEVQEDYIALRDDRHDEEMFIALSHIESFHFVAERAAGRGRVERLRRRTGAATALPSPRRLRG
jgi:hypothetical protein